MDDNGPPQDPTRKDLNPYPFLNPTSILPGWPGFRTHPERSGYDPILMRLEEAHMEGVFLRHMFSGTLRPQNELQEYLMLAWIVVLAVPLASIVTLALLSMEGFECALCASGLLVLPLAALVYNYQKNVLLVREPGADEYDEPGDESEE